MKTHRYTQTLLVLAAGAWHAAGQTAVDLSRQGKLGTGTTLPVRCTVGQVFFLTNAAAGANLYACTTPNTWSVMGLPTLGGDASGTQQAMTVQGIQGRSVSAASPADQNVLRWNAAAGQWQPAPVPTIGTTGPPATCAAGSLYLRSDAANNIQQLYVCSNTNAWTMTSTASGLAANRPVNCVAGQTWLSTDTGAMTYCSATGNPGTWSATLAGPQGPVGQTGPQGPVGASGNTILSGAGAPSAGIGANGDFYLNTAASCLYGPKASGAWPGSCTSLTGSNGNFTATSGASTMTATNAALGVTETSVEPGQSTLPAVGNQQTAFGADAYAGGLFNPAPYGNIVGYFYRSQVFNGFNSPDNTNKDTLVGMEANPTYNGSGQKFGFGSGPTCWGTGDCIGMASTTTYSNRITAWGDEGVKNLWLLMQQANNTMTQNAGTVTKSACAVTALAANVTASGNPTDIKTVAVTGSTAACNIGDWLDIDNGVFGGGGVYGGGAVCGSTTAGPTTDFCHESIQITGKTASTISALFHLPHCGTGGCTPAPVAPSPVIAVTGGSQLNDWGQDAIIVDLNGSPTYAAGTGYNDQTTSLSAIVGVGTTWTSIPVTGPNLQYCMAYTADNVTQSPFSSGSPLVSWFPIQSINSNTSITLGLSYTGSVVGLANAGAYTIRPCGETSQLTLNYNSKTESVNGLVMRSTPYTWTAGHSITQIISPNSAVNAGVQVAWNGYGPHASTPSFYTALNLGYVQANSAFTAAGSPLSSTLAGFKNGLNLQESTQAGQIFEDGIDMSGVSLDQHTYSTAIPRGPHSAPGTTGDVKAHYWSGDSAHDQVWIYPGVTNTGLTIDSPAGARLSMMTNGNPYGLLDFTQTGGSKTYTFPPNSGTVFVPTGGAGIERTIPSDATQTIDIGSVVAGDFNEYAVDVWINSGNSQSARYIVTAWCCANTNWYLVAPLSMEANSQIWQLEAQNSTASGGHLNLRLRGMTGGFGQLTSTTIVVEGIRNISWLPDSTVAVTAAPTAYWDSAFMTQTGNKLVLNYSSRVSATLDPTALTHSITGVPMLYRANTTGSTAFAPAGSNCPATNCVTPYTWMQVTTADGSTAYMPVFK